jgi:hypothetical protein
MAGRKQKIFLEGFSVTVGKLIIEHEVNDADGLLLAQNVREALGQAISAPARLLGAGAPPASTADAVVTLPLPKQSRRRRRTSTSQPSSDGGSNGERTPRMKSGSPRPLVDELKDQGFFAQERAIGEVREELHTKGHAFQSSQLSPVMLAMTRQKSLARKKNEKGEWVYRDA